MRDPYLDARPMTRKRRRRALTLLIVPVVLIVLLAVADRVAAGVAADKIGEKVAQQVRQQDVETSGDPEVEIEGYPFLTQAMRGRYQGVQIHLRDVVARGLAVPRLDIRASDVEADTQRVIDGDPRVEAARITGEAVVGYQSIAEASTIEGLELGADRDRLRVKMSLTVDGFGRVPVEALTRISITGDRVRIDVEKVSTGGVELPPRVRSVFNNEINNLTNKFPIPQLPYNLVIDAVRATDAGLAVTGHADNVLLAS